MLKQNILKQIKKQLVWIEKYIPEDFDIKDYEKLLEKSVYPFNFYEFVISYLLWNWFISFDKYLELREDYMLKNKHLDKFEMAWKKVGKFMEDLLLEWNFGLEKPSKDIDESFSQQTSYDAYMDLENWNIIRVEIKAARFTDRNMKTNNLMEKAIYYNQVFDEEWNLQENIDVNFWLNFQQLKPELADIFIFAWIFRDEIVYWVFTSEEIKEFWIDWMHSWNKWYEWQLHMKPNNIGDYMNYMATKDKLKKIIIEKFTNNDQINV